MQNANENGGGVFCGPSISIDNSQPELDWSIYSRISNIHANVLHENVLANVSSKTIEALSGSANFAPSSRRVWAQIIG